MQLTFEELHPGALKMTVIFEVCNHLFRAKCASFYIRDKLINYFIKAETNNPHFESLMARTIAKISSEVNNPRVNQKLLSIYGGLKKVDLRERYICRMEIFKCVPQMKKTSR